MTRIETVFKIVYKINGKKKTAVVTAKDKDAASKRIKRGARIISISKMDQIGLFGLGDASRILLPDREMLIGNENFFTSKFTVKKNKNKEDINE